MKAGVWIDHRRAVVVAWSPAQEHITVILSKVEKHLERSGDSPMKGSYESLQVPADDRRQRAYTGELNVYYDAVVSALRAAEAMILFGPGEAKGELQRRLVRARLGARVLAVTTVDKMSDRRVAAYVRAAFAAGWSAQGPRVGRANAGLRGRSPAAR